MSFIYNILVDHSLIWGKREFLILAGLAVVAGLIALAVAGILTFIIYQHWEFLKGA